MVNEVGEGFEVLAQARLVEVDFLVWFDEIVLEIVQIIYDGLSVEALGRVGLAVIQAFVPKHLQLHQMAQCFFV